MNVLCEEAVRWPALSLPHFIPLKQGFLMNPAQVGRQQSSVILLSHSSEVTGMHTATPISFVLSGI